MRVTQGMLTSNMLNNLINSQKKMDTYMEQLYSGKKITRPSDDPVIAMKGMNYRNQLNEIKQFERNTGEVHSWMDNSDASLDQATKAMQRLSDLAISAGNATYGSQELQSIKEEAEQIKADLIDIANTKVNGKYIFNGTDTDTKPIITDEDGELKFGHDEGKVMIEVSHSTQLQANVDAKGIFGADLFNNIDGFLESLSKTGEDGEEIDLDLDKTLGDLDGSKNKIIDARASLGARMNRLELIESRLADQKVIATKTMSENEDVEYEEAITNLLTEESLYRAALSAGARVIQPSLIDFLR